MLYEAESGVAIVVNADDGSLAHLNRVNHTFVAEADEIPGALNSDGPFPSQLVNATMQRSPRTTAAIRIADVCIVMQPRIDGGGLSRELEPTQEK